ncbi:serine palmitoyltransferase small subunit B isoform X1 [Meriones unguiculatus]|uniref:serine palmitoyltransferase small subunit B isoform X1 n=1 Tax=Meriones unguiculatus TaxID=10047 RepID=UPI00293ECE53|nr:serine palmitoyltransferase small subunit B isoform X1 [Meriones unguiculatus]
MKDRGEQQRARACVLLARSQPPTTLRFGGYPASCMETPPPNSVRLPLRSAGAPILLKVCREKEQKATSSSNSRFSTISSVQPRMPPPPGVEAEWQTLPKGSSIERLPSPDAPGSWAENSLDWICRMRSLQTLCALSTQPRSQMQALPRIKKIDYVLAGCGFPAKMLRAGQAAQERLCAALRHPAACRPPFPVCPPAVVVCK